MVVENSDLELIELSIKFDHGPAVGSRGAAALLPRGASAPRAIDFPGEERIIKHIDFRYPQTCPAAGRARVAVYGLREAPVFDSRGWDPARRGARSTPTARDYDRIEVPRREGPVPQADGGGARRRPRDERHAGRARPRASRSAPRSTRLFRENTRTHAIESARRGAAESTGSSSATATCPAAPHRPRPGVGPVARGRVRRRCTLAAHRGQITPGARAAARTVRGAGGILVAMGNRLDPSARTARGRWAIAGAGDRGVLLGSRPRDPDRRPRGTGATSVELFLGKTRVRRERQNPAEIDCKANRSAARQLAARCAGSIWFRDDLVVDTVQVTGPPGDVPAPVGHGRPRCPS